MMKTIGEKLFRLPEVLEKVPFEKTFLFIKQLINHLALLVKYQQTQKEVKIALIVSGRITSYRSS